MGALAATCGVVVVAGGVIWVGRAGGPDLEGELTSGDVNRMRAALVSADPEELKGEDARERRRLTIETMRSMPIEDLFKLWRGDDLSDEERELLGKNMRTLWMNYMGEMADEYFSAAPEEKEQLLDRRIDEFVDFRDRMRDYYEAHKDDPEFQERRERERERWRNPSKEDRKEHMLETSPDQQAKMFYMFRQMSERAAERGIDFGFGGRGGGGHGGAGRRERNPGRDRDRTSDRDREEDRGRDQDQDQDRGRGND
jgi:hypothetical protein